MIKEHIILYDLMVVIKVLIVVFVTQTHTLVLGCCFF